MWYEKFGCPLDFESMPVSHVNAIKLIAKVSSEMEEKLIDINSRGR